MMFFPMVRLFSCKVRYLKIKVYEEKPHLNQETQGENLVVSPLRISLNNFPRVVKMFV